MKLETSTMSGLTVETVIVEVVASRDVPEHEETVVNVVSCRVKSVLLSLLVKVELFAERLRGVAVHCCENLFELARFVLIQTLVPE